MDGDGHRQIANDMKTTELRDILRSIVCSRVSGYPHKLLGQFLTDIGLVEPQPHGTKRERGLAAFDALPDSQLAKFAQTMIDRGEVSPESRNEIQELLWEEGVWPEVPKRARRDLLRAMAAVPMFSDGPRFDALLDRLFVLPRGSIDYAGRPFGGLRGDIRRHVHENEDWSAEELFDKLGALEISNRRFGLLLEGLASSDVCTDVDVQRAFVACANPVLKTCRTELREIGEEEGYPVFQLVSSHGAFGSPKNLIFASSRKPDIRFLSAVDNQIEIVSNPDDVLVYDRAISSEGLRWADLQQWWSDTRGHADSVVAKSTLYARLLESLPANSPPQRLLFKAFYNAFRADAPRMPALLPEVWLHWDPKTVRERGPNALLNHRMDFLLLLPSGVRVVVEVDGRQHYANELGVADTARYAATVSADRELKLSGYEVFRFGGNELQGDAAQGRVKSFFEALFRRFGVL
jgi:very-short-patch-repair endonuclease